MSDENMGKRGSVFAIIVERVGSHQHIFTCINFTAVCGIFVSVSGNLFALVVKFVKETVETGKGLDGVRTVSTFKVTHIHNRCQSIRRHCRRNGIQSDELSSIHHNTTIGIGDLIVEVIYSLALEIFNLGIRFVIRGDLMDVRAGQHIVIISVKGGRLVD